MKSNMEVTKRKLQVVIATALGVCCSGLANAETVYVAANGDLFLKGQNVEVGMHKNGYFGSAGNAPEGWHARPNSGSSTGGILGFVANPQLNDWATWNGDFFTPGSMYQGFALQIGDKNFVNDRQSSTPAIAGEVIEYKDIEACGGSAAMGLWQGQVEGLEVQRKVLVPNIGTYFILDVLISNQSAHEVTNVYYSDFFDPDNNTSLSGSHSTDNTIVSQPDTSTQLAHVSATQPAGSNWDESYVAYMSLDKRAKVSFGTWRVKPNVRWSGEGSDVNNTVGNSNSDDSEIAITYKISSIKAGESTSFRYAYNLSDNADVLNCLTRLVADKSVTLNESVPADTQVYDLNYIDSAKDVDPDGNALTYNIVGGNEDGVFAINPTTGLISVVDNSLLDFYITPRYRLQVSASNGSQSDSAIVTVNIQETNQDPFKNVSVELGDNVKNGYPVHDFNHDLTGTDADPKGNTYFYEIVSGNESGIFEINSVTGEVSVKDNSGLDYTLISKVDLVVRGTLSSGRADDATLTINVVKGTEYKACLHAESQFLVLDRARIYSDITAGNRIEIQDDAKVSGNALVNGELFMDYRSLITGNVVYNGELYQSQGAQISGTTQFNNDMLFDEASAIAVNVGTDDLDVFYDRVDAWAPASYGNATIRDRATVTFTAGEYHFASLTTGRDSLLVFDVSKGPITINVADGLYFHDGADFAYVGRTGQEKAIFNTNATAVYVGSDLVLDLNLNAPKADLNIFHHTEVKGCISANNLSIGYDAVVNK
ncbi:exported hypothetical protein [Vibrio nigripulchritudo MADA3029]|uniref:cadherin domain-containing protein n=1 Tax=Vibrio nigripulchritudo TaxID=28173 RepID=UPI0003B1B97B|nr:cadherin domain-containing protein [Vibrio nigripulchritudo]CCN46041.1 exported hypothetical protein [Vibrio nigripulchritudo MADA3020]CCN54308.1 exported hypothetical protein [Vibrio nigripulchritudo MADA3021]CCN59609.1 exported hypothetical protein [Vibrio nigripulchritudo MADA3029]